MPVDKSGAGYGCGWFWIIIIILLILLFVPGIIVEEPKAWLGIENCLKGDQYGRNKFSFWAKQFAVFLLDTCISAWWKPA